MTAERRKEICDAYKSQEQKAQKAQAKKELESKILKPIYDRILEIQQRKKIKELDKLATYLAKKIET